MIRKLAFKPWRSQMCLVRFTNHNAYQERIKRKREEAVKVEERKSRQLVDFFAPNTNRPDLDESEVVSYENSRARDSQLIQQRRKMVVTRLHLTQSGNKTVPGRGTQKMTKRRE
ncbi:uncharacterized protein LOC124276610 [Haliotis rubra]|uniref:uncharacterized protein LOC124276610 n=1 Tax=Haliotis rubra TaxID=36100 RepID=UPI001EE5FE82|nr:uncharacterized protein LOC124276610 [Haliotis rubra]